MEYTLEACSKYKKLSVNGKPVVVFDEHNWALPVWGTYANRLKHPMNLISANSLFHFMSDMSDKPKYDNFKTSWLQLQYDDIRCEIVPDNVGRRQIIETV